jgi:phosphoribosylanthranilate isomerase
LSSDYYQVIDALRITGSPSSIGRVGQHSRRSPPNSIADRLHPILVQIYEVRTPEEAALLSRVGVDHIGVLVGDGAFPRELPAERARAVFAAVPTRQSRVALSLSAQLDEVGRVIEHTQPDIIHIGAAVELFSAADTRMLKAEFPRVLIMRAIPIVDELSIECAKAYREVADFLLLDSHDLGDRQIGGLGRTHDWDISRRIADEVKLPTILAGGLDADNVGAAIAAVRPAGVDSKTKTDRADGTGKDLEKVRRFVAAAKVTTSRQ